MDADERRALRRRRWTRVVAVAHVRAAACARRASVAVSAHGVGGGRFHANWTQRFLRAARLLRGALSRPRRQSARNGRPRRRPHCPPILAALLWLSPGP